LATVQLKPSLNATKTAIRLKTALNASDQNLAAPVGSGKLLLIFDQSLRQPFRCTHQSYKRLRTLNALLMVTLVRAHYFPDQVACGLVSASRGLARPTEKRDA
jgi:hypothetical protein